METSIVVRNADVKTITSPKESASCRISPAAVETSKFSTKCDFELVELDESATPERATEYLNGNPDDELNITEPSTSEMSRRRSRKRSKAASKIKASRVAEKPSTQASLKLCRSDIFVCGICKERFMFPNPIQRHVLEFHLAEKHSYKCSCDDTSFDTIEELLLHKDKYANNTTLLKCELCNLYFSTAKQLARHDALKMFRCNECHETFEKCNLLSEHWLHFNTSGPFKCPFEACAFETRSCYVLKNHATRCQHRPKGADQSARTVSSTRDHACDVCLKVYKKPFQLRQHRKLQHSTFVVYKCEYCKAMFDLESLWRRHKCAKMEDEAESGGARGAAKTQMESMYQCTFCKDTFISMAHLKKHMTTIHFVNIDSKMDILSCLKRINVFSVKQPVKPKTEHLARAPVETRTRAVPASEHAEGCDVKVKVEPQMSEEYERETNEATASLAFLEGLMRSPREAKTEHFLFDIDDEDFEDDIIILDTDNAIQYVKEEPRTPERGDAGALESVDEYLERNERLHTFSMSVERKPCAETPVVVEEAIDVLPRDGNFTVAIDQLLRVRDLFKKGPRKQVMFPCTNVGCNEVFTRKRDIKRHFKNLECQLLNHPPHYQCLRCGVQTDDVLFYIKHWENHNFEANQCPWCLVDTKDALFLHIQEHILNGYTSSGQLFTCRECRIPVTWHSKLQHWESHLLYNERYVDRNKPEGLRPSYVLPKVCSVCSKPFQRSSDLKRHLVEHVLRDALQRKGHEQSLKCDICKEGTTFQTIVAFKQHWREHADLRVYRCKMCDKTFADSSNFTKHKKVHSLTCMQCDVCGRKFASKRMLILHMEYHETNEPLKCVECDKVFYFRSILAKHIKNKHAYKKDGTKCGYCFKQFAGPRELRSHLWAEHGIRKSNADCQFCDYKCRTHMQLRAHYRAKHDVICTKQLKELTDNVKATK